MLVVNIINKVRKGVMQASLVKWTAIKINLYYQHMIVYSYFLAMLAACLTKWEFGKMASFTQQLFQSWPSYWSTHLSNLEQGSRYPVSFGDWVLTKYDNNIKLDILLDKIWDMNQISAYLWSSSHK